MTRILRSIAISLTLFGMALSAGHTFAKQNGPPVSGCSMAQVQSPAAAACLRQLEQDIMSNSPKQHLLVCSISGIYCCQITGTNAPTNCKKVSQMRAPAGNSGLTPSGGKNPAVGSSR